MRLFEVHDTEERDGNQPDAIGSGVFCCGEPGDLRLGSAAKANLGLDTGNLEANGSEELAVATARAERLPGMCESGGVVTVASEG